MTILVTGSSGKTSSRLAALLRPTHKILIASRSGADVNGTPGVKFNWEDADTYSNAYKHPQAQASPITAIYIVPNPDATEILADVKRFIDLGKDHGVKRFVFLAAAEEEETGGIYGGVQIYLQSLGVEWTVLRPTWFMENFSELHHHTTIQEESKIYTAAYNGQLPFVSVQDIAAVAYRALTDEVPHNRSHLIVGPELYTHDEVARLMTEILGREITHVKLTESELARHLVQRNGWPEGMAAILAALDTITAQGKAAVMDDTVVRVTGRPPTTLREFVQNNKQVWA